MIYFSLTWLERTHRPYTHILWSHFVRKITCFRFLYYTHVNVFCSTFQYLLACLVTGEFNEPVHTSDCGRQDHICSNSRSEVIEIDGHTHTAYFCSREDDDAQDKIDLQNEEHASSGEMAIPQFDIKENVCRNSNDGQRQRNTNRRFQMGQRGGHQRRQFREY